ncbi:MULTISPECIES: DEAD/DEAH box helicase family protein [unclassified Vibrio]|uniref:DEAD/DEAH box helicase family protein n=1 Tax=Vibrio sp. HB236076 TaxID=3232307 RepID=A0AB39HJG3_9VIBR|nr:DEAD/DEAH box helicase family protein [Vibrio sp. HB161653]MDP5253007.1 DEAD/DEAH box helicase family protein [Vibrio sp. HB161653]
MTVSSLISSTNLLTTGGDDPLLPQLRHAINHATEIEIAVSFIQPSGLDLLLPTLVEAIERHQTLGTALKLRILTSDYLHITHPIALRSLVALQGDGVEVKIFETPSKTSFHLKSYIFVKSAASEESGSSLFEGSAFIGSNNISRTALTDAYEWCLRFDYQPPEDSESARQFHRIREQFALLFEHECAKALTDEWIDEYLKRRTPPTLSLVGDSSLVDDEVYVPNAVQVDALAALNETRAQGYVRGLVVMGTGMGKTWLSAFDAKQINAKRVLFVAHREEILTQAFNTFAKLWPEKSAGYYNAKYKDSDKAMVFASVQSLGRSDHLRRFEPDAFDYIVVDEFHHASASTYLNILNYFEPRFLLGLTATPERTDQANILSLCHDNLVFERNLVHGIDDEILVPFEYHGIWDESVNYEEIPWRNGKFDPNALDAQLATVRRAKHVFSHWLSLKQSRTLAFCISTKHADYMAEQFNLHFADQGFRALSVHSHSPVRRNEALDLLDKGEVDVLFSVDLFNEGTDLPSIDTVLMVRPTESNIIFIQQLGRGLRRHANKSKLVVLDFIGNHRSFLNKGEILGIFSPSDLAGMGGRSVEKPQLGKGCVVNLDLRVVDFWQQLAKQLRFNSAEEFSHLASYLGHRPRAVEFYRAGYDFNKVNKQAGSWLNLVAEQTGDAALLALEQQHGDFFLSAVQKMSMTKCFKAILLEALIELDGFANPPTLEALAARSWQVLSRYPGLKKDLPEKMRLQAPDEAEWLKYWRSNPINAFIGGNSKSAESVWFVVQDGRFQANFAVEASLLSVFGEFTKELVDFQLAKYGDRDK